MTKYEPKPGDRPDAFMNSVSPNYFTTLGVPIVSGRDFTTQDTGEVLHREPDNWVPTKIIVRECGKKALEHFRGTRIERIRRIVKARKGTRDNVLMIP